LNPAACQRPLKKTRSHHRDTGFRRNFCWAKLTVMLERVRVEKLFRYVQVSLDEDQDHASIQKPVKGDASTFFLSVRVELLMARWTREALVRKSFQ
jgi:hypothetical protein